MSKSTAGEPRLASVASWAVLVASFGLSAATWVALANLAGFTGSISVLGASLALAWLMPVCVDGYVVVALTLWMAPVPAKVARFARTNTYVAASIGVAAQSAYHALLIWSSTGIAWRAVMAAVVGAIPPAVAGLAVHMRALVRRESGRRSTVVEREPERVRTVVEKLPEPVPIVPPVVAPIDPPPLVADWTAPFAATVPAEVPAPAPAVRPAVISFVEPPEIPLELALDGDGDVSTEMAIDPVHDEEAPEPGGSPSASARPAVRRRPAEETRRLASALLAGDPTLTRQDVADALGITVRRLRDVLTGEGKLAAPERVNGRVPDLETVTR
jgi:hypothetical protein